MGTGGLLYPDDSLGIPEVVLKPLEVAEARVVVSVSTELFTGYGGKVVMVRTDVEIITVVLESGPSVVAGGRGV